MLRVSPITNVKNTINNISFKSGVQSNFGANVINNTKDVKHEGNFITDSIITFKQSPFFETLFQRQSNIEKGLSQDSKKLDAIA